MAKLKNQKSCAVGACKCNPPKCVDDTCQTCNGCAQSAKEWIATVTSSSRPELYGVAVTLSREGTCHWTGSLAVENVGTYSYSLTVLKIVDDTPAIAEHCTQEIALTVTGPNAYYLHMENFTAFECCCETSLETDVETQGEGDDYGTAVVSGICCEPEYLRLSTAWCPDSLTQAYHLCYECSSELGHPVLWGTVLKRQPPDADHGWQSWWQGMTCGGDEGLRPDGGQTNCDYVSAIIEVDPNDDTRWLLTLNGGVWVGYADRTNCSIGGPGRYTALSTCTLVPLESPNIPDYAIGHAIPMGYIYARTICPDCIRCSSCGNCGDCINNDEGTPGCDNRWTGGTDTLTVYIPNWECVDFVCWLCPDSEEIMVPCGWGTMTITGGAKTMTRVGNCEWVSDGEVIEITTVSDPICETQEGPGGTVTYWYSISASRIPTGWDIVLLSASGAPSIYRWTSTGAFVSCCDDETSVPFVGITPQLGLAPYYADCAAIGPAYAAV
jgi:hypothetical protein